MTSYERIYEVVCRIPKGKVATYGQIAFLAGNPRWSRVVGYALHVNPDPGVIPCHRVVNREGRTAAAFAFGGSDIQRSLLENEGVHFTSDGCVDMGEYLWTPESADLRTVLWHYNKKRSQKAMREIIKINENIHRITLPYKDIFTTVYTIRTPSGAVLFDAGSFDTDAGDYIVPFLKEVGVRREELRYIFISHNHGDHSGGLKCLMPYYPEACIATRSPELKERYEQEYKVVVPEDGDVLLDMLKVITIPGHTLDSMALLDCRTNTMITGDCLQVYGIVGSQDWASNIRFPVEHLQALEKVRVIGAEQIITAHDYYPCGYRADGKAEVARMIDSCIAPIHRLAKLLRDNPTLDDGQIRQLYNDTPNTPTVRLGVVAATRAAIEEGRLCV